MKKRGGKSNPILTIFLTVFLDLLGVTLIIPILAPLLLEPEGILPQSMEYGARTRLLGYLIATFSVFQFIGAPIVGALSDKYGRRRVLFTTLFVTLTGYLLFAGGIVMKEIAILFVGRALSGIAAGNLSVIYSSIADISTPEAKAKNFGLVGMAFGLGFIIGPVVGGILSDPGIVSWFSFATPFYAAALLVVINLLVVYIEFPETLTEFNQQSRVTLATAFRNVRRAFANPQLRTLFSSIFFFTFGFTFFTQFFQVFLIEKFEFDQADIGYLFGYIGIMVALTQGILVRAASKRFAPRQIVTVALLILLVGYLALLVPDTVLGIYLVSPLIAIGQGLANPNLSAMISNTAPAHIQGETLGMQQSVVSMSQLLPPLVGGVVVALAVSFPLWLAAASSLVSVTIFVIFFFKKKDP